MAARIETIQADIDVGDWQAPPGTEPWAQAVRLRMLSVVKTLDLYPESMRGLVELMTTHQGWRVLKRRDGSPFRDFNEFCAHDRPFGLGRPYSEIRPYLEAVKGPVVTVALTASDAPRSGGKRKGAGRPADVVITDDGKVVPNPREDQRYHRHADSRPRGNKAEYLAARIARDAPEVHEKMKAGVYKSVRAAAKEAGLVKDPDPVKVAARALKRVPSARVPELRADVEMVWALVAALDASGRNEIRNRLEQSP